MAEKILRVGLSDDQEQLDGYRPMRKEIFLSASRCQELGAMGLTTFEETKREEQKPTRDSNQLGLSL